ncbi:MAG: methyltransferase domain-containing protein [Burkholderiales bacterium]
MSTRPSAHRSYDRIGSLEARDALDAHYDGTQGVYKLWASPRSVLSAVACGWKDSDHPAQLHYGWDLERAATLDTAIRDATRRVFDALTENGTRTLDHVLEPGCGIGGAVTQLASAEPRVRFHGVSVVQRQMRIAMARAAARGLGNVSFTRASYMCLPFADDTFDGIYAIESLCYCPVPDRGLLLRELCRVLRPGALAVVLDGYAHRPPATGREERILRDVLDGWTLPPPGPPDAFTADGMTAGFQVRRVEDVTAHILTSARRIRDIGRWGLTPLAALSSLPGMSALLAPIGFASPVGASRFAAACRSQWTLFRLGLGGYWMHVFRKPDVIR